MKDIQNLRDDRRINIRKVGVKTISYPIKVLDKEKDPNIKPMYKPLPPRLWAYTGRRGTTIPTPVTAVNIEKKRVINIFLFRVFIYNHNYRIIFLRLITV